MSATELERQKAIEIIAFWTGKLNTRDLMTAYGISRVQATRDIGRYIQSQPGNLYYHRQQKSYLKVSPFTCRYTQGTVDEYLELLLRTGQLAASDEPVAESSIVWLQARSTRVEPKTMASVLQAIREGRGLRMCYGSMENPTGRERVVYPHVLVQSGFRWHLRAYCPERSEFRDFNLSRILSEPEVGERAPPEAARQQDAAWQKILVLELAANPILTAEQQALIGWEYGMSCGVLKLPTRACLAHYQLQAYQVEPERSRADPARHHLVLLNHAEVAPFLFGTNQADAVAAPE